jgi:hypothetical protein
LETGFRYRDALRLLFILHAGARPIEQPDPQSGIIGVFEGEKRLMAIDFWIRYPDYLADQLLDLYDETKDPALLAEIQSIFDLEEPDVRMIKVLRWRYGAFDRIEDALAILSARNLVKPMKKKIPTGSQHDFLIFFGGIHISGNCRSRSACPQMVPRSHTSGAAYSRGQKRLIPERHAVRSARIRKHDVECSNSQHQGPSSSTA